MIEQPPIPAVVEELARELADRPWTERARYLIRMGDELARVDDAERTEANRVPGCLSNVWLVMDDPDADGSVRFRGDSDSRLVRGLIAVAFRIYAGRSPAELSAHDPARTFERLALGSHVTRNRRDGFRSMLIRLQSLSTPTLPG